MSVIGDNHYRVKSDGRYWPSGAERSGVSQVADGEVRDWEVQYEDCHGKFSLFQTGRVGARRMVGELEMKQTIVGNLIESAAPNSFNAKYVVKGLLRPGVLAVETNGAAYWFADRYKRSKPVLTQRPQEPTIPHDQPMHGRCFTCGVVVECKFSDCKVVDDPPLGRVATVACPNKTMLTERTAEGVKAFAAYKECGAIVRMTQTRGAK